MYIHILFKNKVEYHLWCAGSCDWKISNSGITKLQRKKGKSVQSLFKANKCDKKQTIIFSKN